MIHTITKDNGKIITAQDEIINELKCFYEKLYMKDDSTGNKLETELLFTNELNITQIGDELKSICDEEITEDELTKAVTTSKGGSSPGPDGLPVEFYRCFWDDLKGLFLESISFSTIEGKLSPSQRQGTFCLLHKGKELAKDKLTNWRPISLTNADYKIFSKVLALRLFKNAYQK